MEDYPLVSLPILAITMKADAESRSVIAGTIGTRAHVVYLTDLDDAERADVLRSATVVLTRHTPTELQPGETGLMGHLKLLQFLTAGVDFIPMGDFPETLPIACNGGGYAEPMAEHALAMALAAMKRLFIEHGKLGRGEFDQFRPNRMLRGSVCGILGFGGIGVATARVMRALGVKVHAINRRGASDEPVDWIGSNDALDELLAASDILILSVPLTRATQHMINSRALSAMKRDAVLINLARGEVIEEAALFEHLNAHPDFTACIDAWWVKPVRHGKFETGHDFMSLPNVIASPHNSASVAGWRYVALKRAVENIATVLDGGDPLHLVPPSDRMM